MPGDRMVAALFVQRGGVYFGLDDVDPWDEERDARRYAGPHPVVAHPPCARWGRYWSGGPSAHGRFELGDDGGCFEAAYNAVSRWGGVLEHPEATHAWKRHGIVSPPRDGGWVPAGLWSPGYTCCVEQGHYGHRARKATWLLVVNAPTPALRWGPSKASVRLDDGFHSADERRRRKRTGARQRLSRSERARTPVPFRDILLGIARAAGLESDDAG